MDRQKLENIIKKAIRLTLKEYNETEIKKIGERSFSFRLGVHLSKNKFGKNVMVDSEYEITNLDKTKKIFEASDKLISLAKEAGRKPKDKTLIIRPDLIIHARGPSGPNLALIELKRANAPAAQFKYTMGMLKEAKNQLGYDYAFVIKIPSMKTRGNLVCELSEVDHESEPSCIIQPYAANQVSSLQNFKWQL